MWPIIMAVLRRNSVYVMLPFAAVVGMKFFSLCVVMSIRTRSRPDTDIFPICSNFIAGCIGYNIENMLSDKYTPFSGEQTSERLQHNLKPLIRYILIFLLVAIASIQENRYERLSDDEHLKDATNVAKLRLKENVLGRNLSPSLQEK